MKNLSPAPIRWGILGTARIADKIAPAIQQTPQAELVAVASRDLARAQQWAASRGIPRSYGSYAELLADPDIDAVYVPLPPNLHAPWTIRALEVGLHVLCEKPLADTPQSAAAMVAASRQHRRLLMDGVMWRHHPRAAAMREVLTNGTLGRLKRITAAFTFLGDWIQDNDLRYQRELGGGALLDLGWYCVGATLWATGQLPTRVWGHGRYVNDVDRSFSGVMWFPDDIVASFDCGFETSARKWFEIAGTHASLICDDFTRPWNHEKTRFWVHDHQGKAAEHVAPVQIQEHCLIAEFCRRVRNGEWDTDWAEESHRVQEVCSALEESARSGHAVTVDGKFADFGNPHDLRG